MSLEPLPHGADLPDTDGEPMDSDWVVDQTRIYLIDPLRAYFREQQIVGFASGDTFVYYHRGTVQRLGPDFYVVKGGVPRGQTKWVVWEEGGLYPSLVIEFLSESTEVRDRGEKFCIYRDVFQTEEYFLVNPDTLHIEGYSLSRGHYVARQPDREGWFFCRSLGLSLGVVDSWLRLRTQEGQILWSGRELADRERAGREQERQRAEQECQRADQERQRADQERQRADQAQASLEQEQTRAEEALAEADTLRAELRRLRGEG